MNPENPFAQPAPSETPTSQGQFGSGSLPPLTVTPLPVAGHIQQVADIPQPQPSPQPATQSMTVDYLNQIAPKQPVAVHRYAVFGLIAAVIFAIIAVIAIVNSGGPDLAGQALSIQDRITTLQTVTDAQQAHLKETTISEANATLSSAFTSMNSDLSTIIKAKSLKLPKKTSTEKVYSDALLGKLDTAYQLGTLDRTYTAQMTYELHVLRSMLTKFKTSANSTSITSFCNNSVANIDIILKSYASFAATK